MEIKARVSDAQLLRERAKVESGSEPTILWQEDIFFHVSQGRLKLRKTKDVKSELIAYERVDTEGAKPSDYDIANVADPDSLCAVLTRALGVKGIVKKKRELYMVGQTRVHLDEVEGLGNFMELEVIMKEGQTKAEGIAIVNDLMKKLNIQESDLIDRAYLDLLLDKEHS
ncbi:unnamed protein product [Acanthosepion pharaonis]|uniref:CYTH domain-containing protein n=1 Tax=Acanthosepion pharaonis TaxID=158019 RepID=A0A812BWR1_ACAPH|nr:unnamed protein product [Sepia pharaonis]